MSKRFLSVFLSICMIIPAFSGMSAYAVGEETEAALSASDPMSQVPAENAYEKIHFYFDTAEYANLESVSELASATASVKTDYAATLGVAQRRGTDSNVDENVYITVQFVSEYMEDETYKTLKAARENAKTADERDEAKTNMNRYSKQYHADLVAENLPTLSAIPYTDFHAIDYSSFVTLTVPAASLNASVLEEVADQDNILHISLTDGFEVVAESGIVRETNAEKTGWLDVLECIDATEILEKMNSAGKKLHTGEGVKVGIYEADGVPNVFHANLENTSITIRDCDSDTVDIGHATQVASIISLIAPDAALFCAKLPEPALDTEMEGLVWFIQNNCDIVNCSFGFGNNGFYRYDIDAVYDYQVDTNDIVVVKSAGNTQMVGSDYITSPGLARNVLTVGGSIYSTAVNGWVSTSSACYVTGESILKPNVSAPKKMYVRNIYYQANLDNMDGRPISGTSFSAAMVTACAALYIEYYHEYISSGHVPSYLVRSVVMASANKTADYQSVDSNFLADNNVGAGIIDLEKMLSTNIGISVFSETAPARSEFKSISIYVPNGTVEMCIALNWNASAVSTVYGTTTNGYLSSDNVDLRLYRVENNGNKVLISSSMYGDESSTEYIRCPIMTSGCYYQVVLFNSENYISGGNYALAYKRTGVS